jgi:anti-sigma regulatory factor (Ser/Thr protein kinase)
MPSVLQTLFAGGPIAPGAIVEFNFDKMRWIDPSGITFLSNIVHWLAKQGHRVTFSGLDTRTDALGYLDDALFFEQHLGRKLSPSSQQRPTTMPLRQLRHAESHAWLKMNMRAWLSSRTGYPRGAFDEIQVCISELFNNIRDHTQLEIGSIFAQHFPTKKEVRFAVADVGFGIPDTVRRKVQGLGDAAAIIQAVEEGFTTKSLPTNQGAGLAHLLRIAVLLYGGKVTIYSGRSMVTFFGLNGQIAYHPFDVGMSPGTLIEIVLPTERLKIDQDAREDLEW